MAVTMLNPEGLPQIELYRHVSVATGSKLVSVAGQVAHDADGSTVVPATTPPRSSRPT